MAVCYLLSVRDGLFVLTKMAADTPEEASLRQDAALGWCDPPVPEQQICDLDPRNLADLLRPEGVGDALVLEASTHFPYDEGVAEGTDVMAIIRLARRLARGDKPRG